MVSVKALLIFWFINGFMIAILTLASEVKSIKYQFPKVKGWYKKFKFIMLVIYRFFVIVFTWYFLALSMVFEEIRR